MIDLLDPQVEFALHAVHKAALLVKMVQTELVSPALTKDDRSPVTVADFASQALVGYLLGQYFPGDALIAEEDSQALRSQDGEGTLAQVARFVERYIPNTTPSSVCDWIDHARSDYARRFWTLDPIDGTKGFLRGEQYAVALALIESGQVQVAALGCPNLSQAYLPEPGGPGCVVIAARGQGAWTAPLAGGQLPGLMGGGYQPLHASTKVDPALAIVLRSVEAGHTNVDQVDQFAQALGVQAQALRMDSQAKYAVLAAGQGELYLRLLSPNRPDYREKIWDQAAGSLILAEAGGMITDLDGQPLDFTTGRSLSRNRGILASNGHLHQAALQALRQVGA